MNPLAKQLMNRGNSRERALGRALARGRTRGLDGALALAAEQAAKVAKDFGGAPAAPTTAAMVHTPVPDGPKRVTRKSRLAIPFSSDE